MADYEKFPTPADIAPEQFKVPDLDEKWETAVMDEIAAFLYKKQADLQAKRQVRFIPATRRDMGYARQQWLHYHKRIADLVREKGWTVMIAENGAFPVLAITMPGVFPTAIAIPKPADLDRT